MLPVHEYLLAALGILGSGVAPSDHLLGARRKKFERCEVAVHDRQVFHVFFVKLDGNVGAIGFQLLRLGRDFHLLAGRTHLKLAVDTCGSVGRNFNILKLKDLKSLRFDANGVGVRNQVSHIVVSTLVCRGLIGRPFRLVDDSDFCIGNGCPRGIGHRATDAAENCLARCL